MNNDLAILYNCRNTLIELLRDRGYTVPEIYICNKMSEFRSLHQSKKLDIFVKEPKKCYAKFVIVNKTRPQVVREYIADIQKKYTGEDGSIIIILKNKPHTSLFKLSKDFKNIQFFWLNELINNITHHNLNPKFIKISQEQEIELLERYDLRSKLQLPIILASDPISKYFGYVSGDICKIERKSITNGIDISYRCVK